MGETPVKKVKIAHAMRAVVYLDENGKKKVRYEKINAITSANAVMFDGKTLRNKMKEYYNKGEVDALLATLKGTIEAIKGLEDATEAIDSMNEIIAFLDTFKNDETLANVLATMMTDMEEWVEAKGYAGAAELETLKNGLATVARTGSYNDLTDKPEVPSMPDSLPADGGNADTVDGYHFVVGEEGTAANTIYFVI